MASLLDPQPPINPLEDAMMWVRDSTLTTALQTVVGGYIMGFGLSLFGSMISAESTTQCMGVADFFKYSVRSAHRMGYNFSFFGFIFSGIEVALEKRRGRKDLWNPTASGAVIGGYYGWASYRRPGLVGGILGGAAMSVLFEKLTEALGFGQK